MVQAACCLAYPVALQASVVEDAFGIYDKPQEHHNTKLLGSEKGYARVLSFKKQLLACYLVLGKAEQHQDPQVTMRPD